MTATSYMRGHQVYYDEEDKIWKYTDDCSIADDSRPCVRCEKYPTKEGYDVCMGYIQGATSVCCGHGVGKKYIVLKEEVKE